MTIELHKSIIDLLTEGAYLSHTNVKVLQKYIDTWHLSPFQALFETKMLGEVELADILAESLRIDRIYNIMTISPNLDAMRAVGYKRAKAWKCYPLGWRGENREQIELVVADPTTAGEYIQELKQELGCEIIVAVGEISDISGAIDEFYPLSEQLPSVFKSE